MIIKTTETFSCNNGWVAFPKRVTLTKLSQVLYIKVKKTAGVQATTSNELVNTFNIWLKSFTKLCFH